MATSGTLTRYRDSIVEVGSLVIEGEVITAADVASTGRTYPTIAALTEASPIAAVSTVYVEGYYASGDRGGHWRTRGTGDGEITDASGGTWVVVNGDSINVRHYGAKGDGVTDDATAFQNAALNVTALCGTLAIPPGAYLALSAVALPDNLSVFIQGAGSRLSRILWNGETGGFTFTNSLATVENSQFLGIAGVSCTTTTNNTIAAFTATWRPCIYHLRPYLYVDDLWIGAEDNDAAQAFAYGLRLSSVVHGYIGAYSFNNSLVNRVGKGISFEGYCLANMVIAPQINQCGTGISFGDLPVDVVTFDSQTTNFTPGSTFTTSAGASGVIISMLADAGATGTVVLWVGSGTISADDVITDSHGGNGTADTIDPRTWGSEGLQITSGSIVGCDYGITAVHSHDTAKRGALLDINGTHINSKIYDVHAEEMYQVFVKGADLYIYGANGEHVRLLGVDQASVIGNEYHLGAAVSGVIGVHILPDTSNPFNSVNIDVNANKFFGLATGIKVEADVEKSRLYYNAFEGCTVDINNLSTVYPADLDGIDIRDNWYSDGTFDDYYAKSMIVGASSTATTATDGFLYLPSCAGTPTGVPVSHTGRVPVIVDSTNSKLYGYIGSAWVDLTGT